MPRSVRPSLPANCRVVIGCCIKSHSANAALCCGVKSDDAKMLYLQFDPLLPSLLPS